MFYSKRLTDIDGADNAVTCVSKCVVGFSPFANSQSNCGCTHRLSKFSHFTLPCFCSISFLEACLEYIKLICPVGFNFGGSRIVGVKRVERCGLVGHREDQEKRDDHAVDEVKINIGSIRTRGAEDMDKGRWR